MPTVKLLTIFVRSDVNEVSFDNIWAFKRNTVTGPWDVSIRIPYGASLIDLHEPVETGPLSDLAVVSKNLAPDSLIDSVGFTFAVPNQNRSCKTLIKSDYHINSIVVYVSGSATKLDSSVLKFDRYRTLHSKFSNVYTAGKIEPGNTIDFNLTALPAKNSKVPQKVCIVGLVLIILATCLTLFWKQ